MIIPYKALLLPVAGRELSPIQVQERIIPFLDELVAWGKEAPDSIFAPNDEPDDVMPKLVKVLGPWKGKPGSDERAMQRRCYMLELLRCLGGFESSWKWGEGVDRTNKTSQLHPECEEAGMFQVSYNSHWLEKKGTTLKVLLAEHGIINAQMFIKAMKSNHKLALTYAAMALRVSYKWDGPILRDEINSSLKKEAVAEFATLLAA